MGDWPDYIDNNDGFDILCDVFNTLKKLGIVENYLFDYWEGHLLDEDGNYIYYTDVMVDLEIWVKDEYWAHSRHKGPPGY